MRGWVVWVVGIVAGVVLVLLATALVGNRDKSGETVPAGEWADSVCGSVAVWRGQIESIVDELRQPSATGSTGTTEPQSETPQSRTGFVRTGLERTILATDTLLTSIDNAGTPDTSQGEQAANAISGWADATRNDLHDAQDALDVEAETLAEAVTQLTKAAGAITGAVTSGVKAVADVARTDPELAAALRDSSTCQELRKETTS